MSTHLNTPAERFARLIDFDIPPVFLDGGDPRMRPAVALTAALRSAADAGPAPMSQMARSAMRERLVALAASAPEAEAMPAIAGRITHALEQRQEHAQKKIEGAGRRIGQRMSALIGSVVILTSLTGVGVATARALPGSPFYDLKRATESVQLWATSGQVARGQRHLEFARNRLAEAQKLPADSPYLAATLNAMNSQTRKGDSDLLAAYNASGSVQPLATLVVFARSQYAELAQLGAKLPSQLRQQAVYSATLLTGVSHQVKSLTVGLCTRCAAGATKPGSSGTKPGPQIAPTTSSKPSSGATSPSVHPTPTPSNLLPTKLLPTLPPLLHHKKGQPLPKLSPLPLLSSLAQLLTGS